MSEHRSSERDGAAERKWVGSREGDLPGVSTIASLVEDADLPAEGDLYFVSLCPDDAEFGSRDARERVIDLLDDAFDFVESVRPSDDDPERIDALLASTYGSETLLEALEAMRGVEGAGLVPLPESPLGGSDETSSRGERDHFDSFADDLERASLEEIEAELEACSLPTLGGGEVSFEELLGDEALAETDSTRTDSTTTTTETMSDQRPPETATDGSTDTEPTDDSEEPTADAGGSTDDPDDESSTDDAETTGDAGAAESESIDPAAVDGDVVVAALAEGLANDTLPEEQVETIRDELRPEVPRSLRVELEHVQSRLERFGAYTDAIEEFIDENGTAQEALSDCADRIETLEEDVADLEATLESALEDVEDALDRRATTEELETVAEDLDDVESTLQSVADLADETAAWRERVTEALATDDGEPGE